jgi:alpha-tubulin suppressor-like RCC1 family protein
MRTTRRLLDGRVSAALLILAAVSAAGAMTASCSSSDQMLATVEEDDAGTDAASDSASGEDVADAATKDVELIDATPLPIECPSPPCAVALTTTIRGDNYTREEGYCALLTDSTVACWGANTAGQLGNGTIAGDDSPIAARVPGLSGITALNHTCAVDSDGAVWCWGKGPFLQAEDAAVNVEGSPVRLVLPGPAEKVAVASRTACAILRDKSMVCWGANYQRQIGEDLPISRDINTPPRAIAAAAGAKDIALGDATFALYAAGKLLSWGANPGIGRATPISPDGWPTPILLDHVTMVDTIDSETCAVANGVGWRWGPADPQASLTSPNPYARALPIAVDTPEPITRIATSRSWSVTEGNRSYDEMHRWCATTISGDVYCRGLNNAGQAGNGDKEFALGAVRVSGLPAPAAEVKVMPYSTCAILTNGKVYCWGNNSNGQLGAGLPKGSVVVPAEVKLP